jgi:hypothetical protein
MTSWPDGYLSYLILSALISSRPTQPSIVLLRPSVAANAVSTPQHVIRIVFSLHRKQAVVIRAKEGSAPIRLVRVALPNARLQHDQGLDLLTSLKYAPESGAKSLSACILTAVIRFNVISSASLDLSNGSQGMRSITDARHAGFIPMSRSPFPLGDAK